MFFGSVLARQGVGGRRDLPWPAVSIFPEAIQTVRFLDLYAEKYVERMVTEMKKRSLVALTLSGWYNFFEARGCAGYSEPKSWDPEDQDEMDEILYGYGFSYVQVNIAKTIAVQDFIQTSGSWLSGSLIPT